MTDTEQETSELLSHRRELAIDALNAAQQAVRDGRWSASLQPMWIAIAQISVLADEAQNTSGEGALAS